MRAKAILTLCAVVFSSSPLLAHDLWLSFKDEADGRRVVANYGHPDDRPSTIAEKIVDLVVIDSSGSRSILAGAKPVIENGIGVVTSAPLTGNVPVLAAARYDNGFWITTKDGHSRNVTRRLASEVKEGLWSGKFAKAVSGAGAPWGSVLGHELEIAPLSDPALARPGTALKVRVIFRGKALAGCDVERGDGRTVVAEKDIPRFTTDADGVASIPIVKSGPQLLVVDHRVRPSATPDQADVDLFNGTFWFMASGKT